MTMTPTTTKKVMVLVLISVFGLILLSSTKIVGAQSSGSQHQITAARLFDNVLLALNPHTIPLKDVNDTLEMTVEVKLSIIEEVNYMSSYVAVQLYLVQEWDSAVKWDAGAYGDIDEISIPVSKIWTPDITLYNAAGITQGGKAEAGSFVRLSNTGRVHWAPLIRVKAYCDLDLRASNFPVDSHNCFFKFGSWTYNGFSLNIQDRKLRDANVTDDEGLEDGIDLSSYYPNLEYKLETTSVKRHVKVYPCCPEPYTDLFYSFKLSRRSGVEVFTTFTIPWAFLTMVPVLIFALPTSEVNTKVMVSGITFLVTIVLGLNFGVPNLPYFVNCWGFSGVFLFCSTGASVLLANLCSRSSQMPEALRTINDGFVQITNFGASRATKGGGQAKGLDEEGPEVNINGSPGSGGGGHDGKHYNEGSQEGTKVGDEWAQLAGNLDRIFLGLFLIVGVIGVWGYGF